MIISELKISNFRRFESLSITFEEDLTVIVARNGQGKTTLLDAITVTLGTFVGAFEMGKARHIEKSDARLMRLGTAPEGEAQYPVEVHAVFKNPDLEVFRELTGPKNKTTIRDAHQITEHGAALQAMVSRLEEDPLPLVSYYGAGRLWKAHKNVERKKVLSASRTIGYEDCLSSSSNFLQCQQWMNKATLAFLQEPSLEQKPDISMGEKLGAIQDAVDFVLKEEGWSGFHYSFTYEELTMFHPDHGHLPVSLLSDGVRGMVSMTADIAFRCVRLNGYLGRNAPRKTQGIVLIDEVDIHLHPAWQQRVIKTLREAFPSIQFIVTTHSPQVLSTVPSECIRILQNGEVHAAPPGSEGAEPGRLLKQILGLEEIRPAENQATKELKEYLALVDEDQWGSPRALALRAILDSRYQGNEPALLEADLHIENRKWELGV